MIAGDMAPDYLTDLCKMDPMILLDGLIYECRLDNTKSKWREWCDGQQYRYGMPRRMADAKWLPGSIRWDKVTGNDEQALETMQRTIPLTHQAMLTAITSAQHRFDARIDTLSKVHPARTMTNNNSLYEQISEAVAKDEVERTLDEETGLEIFNHKQLLGSSATSIQSICRGLVFFKCELVATPFTRFTDKSLADDGWNDDIARASFKVDGSLAIAFLWDGQLQVNTRRRMDSQQAMWTKQWLRSHTPLEAFEKGWTYLFETVFNDNTVVVPYPFEAPILLAAISPDGVRASHNEGVILAAQMGVMLSPSISGAMEELKQYLMPQALSPPSYEGWVITTSDGRNTKLVTPEYKQASIAASRLHPLAVWDRIRTGGESRTKMLHHTGLAMHHREELSKILDALQAAYIRAAARFDYPQMHFNTSSMKNDFRHARAAMLDKIKPGPDGSLPGYTPSTGCMLTIAKGWVGGVRSGRMSAQVPLIHTVLASILGLVLETLEGETMQHAVLVNKEWSTIICSAPGFKAKAEAFITRKEEEDPSPRGRYFSSPYSRGRYSPPNYIDSYAGYGSN
jgi:hypothetical protein